MVFTVMEVMHTCVAVHAVPSTSADVRVVIKPTIIDWTNCCRDSDVIAKILTEAGWSIFVACTGVIIANTNTVITHALVLVLVLVSLVGETMHSWVAVHAVLSTSADVRVVMKLTVQNWTDCWSRFSGSGGYYTWGWERCDQSKHKYQTRWISSMFSTLILIWNILSLHCSFKGGSAGNVWV